MPSKALAHWQTASKEELDEFEKVHGKTGGTKRGRRYLTNQLNHSYLVAVSAQFQRFCRDLHTEAAQRITAAINPQALQLPILRLFTSSRRLDKGNANEGNLGPDYGLLGMSFFSAVQAASRRNENRRARLRQLNIWRNAIVHADFTFNQDDRRAIAGTQPQLRFVRLWRHACDDLAVQFDAVVRAHVSGVVGGAPWK